jgi:CRP-like cAMP-binding protein/thioredoxin reductase/ferredoxin-like protein FixX
MQRVGRSQARQLPDLSSDWGASLADFKIAIIGSGPAGLSAAAHAARKGVPHVLLERTDHVNDTIFKYQKRKLVMATPVVLPLRSDLDFKEESREEVIDSWDQVTTEAKVNLRLKAEVNSIKGKQGDFTVGLADGSSFTAEYVILAIGVQGNLNKLTVPGADLPFVQYQLDDPDMYKGEEILIIGVGDAGIENALGLAPNNMVSVVNTNDDFPRAKPANQALIQNAIKKGDEPGGIHHITKVKVKEIQPGKMLLEDADGSIVEAACDRVIARIGAQPPRRFLESCGIEFTSTAMNAIPEVSDTYESQVQGLYIIGALAGYPLIKNCLNQGYEAVEYILGNNIPPADEPLIQEKLNPNIIRMLNPAKSAITGAELITEIQKRTPLFSALKPIQIREFLIHSELHNPQAGGVVFERNEFANSVYSILEGEVGIQVNPADPNEMVRLGPGEFFGEMALISGRRRTTTVVATKPSLLIEVDRNTMVKLVRSEPSVKQAIDGAAVVRQIKTYLAADIDDRLLSDLVASTTVKEFRANDTLIKQGDTEDDSVYLIRKGHAVVSVQVGGKEVPIAYVQAGNYVGEMALLLHQPRTATVKAGVATEAIQISSSAFRSLLEDKDLHHKINEKVQDRLITNQQMRDNIANGDLISFLAREGVGEATDVLLIDESLCVRCDNCEKACAETHHGVSRLNREAGATFDMLHVPTSCRHCEDPHCMTDCPPDAIHRAPNGEVYINDQCIGCGNCERNCPYSVIQLAAVPTKKPGLLSWLLFGMGPGPGEDKSPDGLAHRIGSKHAVKCDLCKDIDGGPACVRACPTGAAIRVEPAAFIDVMRQARL